jgi:hypothetical protein
MLRNVAQEPSNRRLIVMWLAKQENAPMGLLPSTGRACQHPEQRNVISSQVEIGCVTATLAVDRLIREAHRNLMRDGREESRTVGERPTLRSERPPRTDRNSNAVINRNVRTLKAAWIIHRMIGRQQHIGQRPRYSRLPRTSWRAVVTSILKRWPASDELVSPARASTSPASPS